MVAGEEILRKSLSKQFIVGKNIFRMKKYLLEL